jgi:hypothetical protein
LSWGLLWIVNRMPNFGKRPRPPVRLHQLNPYLRRGPRRSGLSDDGIERILDNMAKRSGG